MRKAIDGLRAQYRLSGFAWTGPALAAGDASVKAVHMTDLGTALHEVFVAAGMSEAYVPSKSPNILEIQSAVFTSFKLGRPDEGDVR